MATENGDMQKGTLCFKAYRSDPLATFVISHKWAPWQFAAAYVVTYLFLLGIAYLTYPIRDGAFDLVLHGGYPTIAALVAVIIVVGGVGGWFYIFVSSKAGEIYDELARARVISRGDPAVHALICGSSNSIQNVHQRPIWTGLAVIVASASVLLGIYSVAVAQSDDVVTV